MKYARKNQDMFAVAESWKNGKPVRETLAATPAGDNLHFVTRTPTCASPSAPDENVLSSTFEWSTP